MGDEISKSHFSRQDFKRFKTALRRETELLRQLFLDDGFSHEPAIGGFEIEGWLIDERLDPSPKNDLFIEKAHDLLVVPELSKFNIELNSTALRLEGDCLSRMEQELRDTWSRSCRVAEEIGCQLLLCGILPTVTEKHLSLDNISQLERYRALNEQMLRLRQGRPFQLDIKGRDLLRLAHTDVMLEAAATSFQIHLQVEPQKIARYYNASLLASAPMVAATANSPYLFNKDLWDETRIPLFEQAISVFPENGGDFAPWQRVSFGSGFIRESLFEYFLRNEESYPLLLPEQLNEDPMRFAHVRLHNGTIWNWNRPLIGFNGNGGSHLRIEHRTVAAGPSLIDTIANATLYYGLCCGLGDLPTAPEMNISFEQTRQNFYDAARFGLDAEVFWIQGKKVPLRALLLEELLPLARETLMKLEIDKQDIQRYLGIVEQRVNSKRNGAYWQRAYVSRYGADMQALAGAYLERQKSGQPVHEWFVWSC